MKKYVLDKEKRSLLLTLISGIALLFSFFEQWGPFPVDPAWIAIILCGFPILKAAITGFASRFSIKSSTLISIALVAAIYIGETFAAGEVAFIMMLGELLEARTIRKARKGIEKLVSMAPHTARLMRNGIEYFITAKDVEVGNTLRVLPGETIVVDGKITFGETSVDQSLMTGESLPVDKRIGDEVYSGTINQFGSFDMKVTKVGQDSSIQRMIRLVESAEASKTPIVRLMDRVASQIVIAALLTAGVTWLLTGDIIRAVTILVVFCPCALVLATPTAIMAAIGRATRLGILISSGDTLEKLAKVTRIIFDKTGTLTHGKPEVIAILPVLADMTETELLYLAAMIEQRSEHPLGKAILRYANAQGIIPDELESFKNIPGKGILIGFDKKQAAGGNWQMMTDFGIESNPQTDNLIKEYTAEGNAGRAVVYISLDKQMAGLIVLADTLRTGAKETVDKLHDIGLDTSMLTGDNPQVAHHIASMVGISDVHAALLPEDKLRLIQEKNLHGKSEKICMVGDGINDAPALKAAYVGLAMGKMGSDIALEAADAILMHDDIGRLPQLIELSKKTVSTIKTNIILSMSLNFMAIGLAASGLIGPVVGALVHNVGALVVIMNSIRLLRGKPSDQDVASIPKDPDSGKASKPQATIKSCC